MSEFTPEDSGELFEPGEIDEFIRTVSECRGGKALTSRAESDLARVCALGVTIHDDRAADGITPDGARAYLGFHGWRLHLQEGCREFWRRDEAEVLVPLRPDYGDTPKTFRALIGDLAEAEGRSGLAVMLELVRASEAAAGGGGLAADPREAVPEVPVELAEKGAHALREEAYDCDGYCGKEPVDCYRSHPVNWSGLVDGETRVEGEAPDLARVVLSATFPDAVAVVRAKVAEEILEDVERMFAARLEPVMIESALRAAYIAVGKGRIAGSAAGGSTEGGG